ncbi:hypothetical protein [Flavobacterium sp. N2270]|uniref:hypothetical protein n=1 Tax=Flavobacterium sp. N2270 TaxID=2986831 RepID=UPI0022252038|nr:hypothetical protein [Flavobacterium sp. N2270]
MKTYQEKCLINQIKFYCSELVDFNSKLEVRTLKVYKHKRIKGLLKYKKFYLYLIENDWLNYRESCLDVFLISDLIIKKDFIGVVETQYLSNGLTEEKLIEFYKISRFWKKFLISKYNSIATNY